MKTFSTQSASNNSAASALCLERARALLDAGTTVVDELKQFAETMGDATPDAKTTF